MTASSLATESSLISALRFGDGYLAVSRDVTALVREEHERQEALRAGSVEALTTRLRTAKRRDRDDARRCGRSPQENFSRPLIMFWTKLSSPPAVGVVRET